MKIIRQKIIRKEDLNEEKKLAFLTGIVAIVGAVILVYKKVKKKAAPKSEESDDESSDKVDDEEDLSIFEDEI